MVAILDPAQAQTRVAIKQRAPERTEPQTRLERTVLTAINDFKKGVEALNNRKEGLGALIRDLRNVNALLGHNRLQVRVGLQDVAGGNLSVTVENSAKLRGYVQEGVDKINALKKQVRVNSNMLMKMPRDVFQAAKDRIKAQVIADGQALVELTGQVGRDAETLGLKLSLQSNGNMALSN